MTAIAAYAGSIRRLGPWEWAAVSAMIVILVGGVGVGATFAEQKLRERAQLGIGHCGADDGTPPPLLRDKACLREDLHVVREGGAGDAGARAKLPDAQPFGACPDQGAQHGETMFAAQSGEGGGGEGKIEMRGI